MVLQMKKHSVWSLLVLSLPWSAAAADFSNWAHAVFLKLNTSATGANVSGTVTNFPVLVRLNAANFNFDQAKSDGSDLRFSKNEAASNATELAMEIERWDNANKLAEIWVKVPEILGDNSQQGIKMYWGHQSPPTPTPSSPVFSSSNGFAGAWHLKEASGTGTVQFKDVTPSGNHSTAHNLNSSHSVAGISGLGVEFKGSQSITTANNGNSLHPTGPMSIEFWVNPNQTGSYKRIVSKAFSSSGQPWEEYDIQTDGSSGAFAFVLGMGSSQSSVVSSPGSVSIGQWRHVAGTYDQTFMRIYVDGVLQGSLAKTGAISDYGQPITMGKYQHDGASNFNGLLDEVRISTAARSADWVKLSYMNQRPDQKLVEKQGADLFTGVQGALFQKYDNIGNGLSISSLLNVPHFPEDPAVTRIYPAMDWQYPAPNEVVGGAEDRFGVLMSGWIQAPETGLYTFYIAGDDRAELRLSADGNPVGKQTIAAVTNWSSYGDPNKWFRPEQTKTNVLLTAGKLYYIEALMTEETGGAHLAVGWTLPSQIQELPIRPERFFLSPSETDQEFPSVINLYERLTSNKKASLGWDNTPGRERMYVETAGGEKLRVDETGVTATGAMRAQNFVSGGSVTVSNPPGPQTVATTMLPHELIVAAHESHTSRTIEARISNTEISYVVKSLPGGEVLTKTRIDADGLYTTGSVSTKKWKVPTPDYVFAPGYRLASIPEVEAYVRRHGHLPEIPSAREMEGVGIDLGEMDMRLLKKIEELTLHLIEMDKRLKSESARNRALSDKLDALAPAK